MIPVEIDLSGLKAQFGLASSVVDSLTETCINEVTTAIYVNWEALAKQRLNSTLPEYLNNLIKVDKGRFAKQIVLTGTLPLMLERGASAFDIKEGFRKSRKVKYTIAVYNKKGKQVSAGGAWYLSIPFRIGVPGTLGQAGFSGQMPQEIYDVMRKRAQGAGLSAGEIPSPYDALQSRAAIVDSGKNILFAEYTHKNSIYDGLTKRTGVYGKTNQNTYGTFRRAGQNSDPMSWIHKGIKAYNISNDAVDKTDVDTIVENEVTNFLETIL